MQHERQQTKWVVYILTIAMVYVGIVAPYAIPSAERPQLRPPAALLARQL